MYSTHEEPRIRPATPDDSAAIADIYNYYIKKTTVTFEEEPISPSEMARRMEEASSASLPWVVAELGGRVVGFAHGSEWKGRCAYRFSVEITVYVDPDRTGLGVGTELCHHLLLLLEKLGIHSVIGAIALPNEASVALHEKLGFEKVAHFKEVGFKFGKWVDVGYWQLVLRGPKVSR